MVDFKLSSPGPNVMSSVPFGFQLFRPLVCFSSPFHADKKTLSQLQIIGCQADCGVLGRVLVLFASRCQDSENAEVIMATNEVRR